MFLNYFITAVTEDGETTYNLTTAGYTGVTLLMLLILLLGSRIFSDEKKYGAKQLAFSAICIALGFVTSSFCKLFDMPMGGSATLLSMFFITFIGYMYGPRCGLFSAIAYGFLQLVFDPYIISLPQMITDYILAFGALGLSGLYYKKSSRLSLIFAYLTGVLGRYFFSFLSGYIFFGMWAPDNFPNAAIYSLAYNGAYLGAEALLTVVVLVLPGVSKALLKIKTNA